MAALLPSTNTLETFPTANTLQTFRDVVSAQGVDEQLVAACAQAVGRTLDDRLTPVQAAVWAVGFERDVVAIAPTGSGKTLAFLLPALVAVARAPGAAPAAVALCPTRELALQTRDVAARAASALGGVAVAAVVGGEGYAFQKRGLAERPPRLVVATPGRLGQLCDDAAVSLARVALLALDECDRLLSPEFEVATARLVLCCRREAAPRLILATATLAASAKVRLLAPNATRVAVGAAPGVGALSASLELRFAIVQGRGAARLKALLAALADDEPAPTPEDSPTPRASDDDDDDESGGDDDESSGGDDDSEEDRLDDAFVAMMRRRVAADASPSAAAASPASRSLVFVAHKRETLGVAADLRDRGRRAAALHGDLSQSQRAAAIARFRAGADDVLVATDVAARGLDVDDVARVVCLGLVGGAEAWVHKVGRCARNGARGVATTIVSGDDALLPALVAVLDANRRPARPELAERARRVAARPPRPPRPPSDGDETDDETRARRNRDRQREREKAKQQKQHAQQKKKGGRKRR